MTAVRAVKKSSVRRDVYVRARIRAVEVEWQRAHGLQLFERPFARERERRDGRVEFVHHVSELAAGVED